MYEQKFATFTSCALIAFTSTNADFFYVEADQTTVTFQLNVHNLTA